VSQERALPPLLRVHHEDPITRMRAVNALVLTYGMIGAGLVGAIPLFFIPNGPAIAAIVLGAVLVFAAAAFLLRSGRVRAGLVVFFAAFLGSFAAVPVLGQDARLSAVYCCLPVVVATVTLHRGGVAVVTALALVIAVIGTALYPPVDPPPTTFEIITAAVLLIVVCLVSGLLGMWGRRQETRRADLAAEQAVELAANLKRANAELERRVEERTDALQKALSQQETLVAELADLSLRDPLTGLYNRRHAEHELPRLIAAAERYGTPLSLALADLDHFKQVNDTWSYSVGDEVLLRFTEILRDTARSTDLVTRYGGEEFLLVMPQTTAEQAVVLCERLRTAVEAHPWHEIVPGLHLTVSVGVADSMARDGIAALTEAADSAVHAAKRNGRNRIELAPPAPAPLPR
jgi:diguanylate cyclase (GGDEF)-like protein